jgi:hypothetical protein
MNLPITSTLLFASLVLTAIFGWFGARPAVPGRTRLTPWRFMMLLAFTGLIAMAVHIVTLVRGVQGGE